MQIEDRMIVKKKIMVRMIVFLVVILIGLSLFAEEKVNLLLRPINLNEPVYLLSVKDYERLKELQYVNVFKTILDAPSDVFVIKKGEQVGKFESLTRYEFLKHKMINHILESDSYGYFKLSDEFLARVEKEYGIKLVNGVWVLVDK